MIRVYQSADRDQVRSLVQAGVALLESDLGKQPEAGKAFVYDDGEIQGASALIGHELFVYVRPERRGQGIGSALLDAIWPVVTESQGTILARRRVDGVTSRTFFHARGFAPIVDLHLMRYTGGALPEPSLAAKPYTDALFADYLQINNQAFYDLRQEAGLEPNVFGPDTLTDEGLRREVLAKGANIWHFELDGQPMGLVELDGSMIETVAVLPTFQGRGLGRALAQFAVNRLLERGAQEVRLVVGEPNVRARQLYERLGFELVQVDELSRIVR